MTRFLLILTALSAALPAGGAGPETGPYGGPIEVSPLK